MRPPCSSALRGGMIGRCSKKRIRAQSFQNYSDLNLDLLKQLGTVVWVTADEATLFERASRRNDRPLLQKENPRAVFSKLFRSESRSFETARDRGVGHGG